jgi:hypothetical protein
VTLTHSIIQSAFAVSRSRPAVQRTEAVNNLIKRIKPIVFGFRRFTHHRIRVLLYAGRPNWDLLGDASRPTEDASPL